MARILICVLVSKVGLLIAKFSSINPIRRTAEVACIILLTQAIMIVLIYPAAYILYNQRIEKFMSIKYFKKSVKQIKSRVSSVISPKVR